MRVQSCLIRPIRAIRPSVSLPETGSSVQFRSDMTSTLSRRYQRRWSTATTRIARSVELTVHGEHPPPTQVPNSIRIRWPTTSSAEVGSAAVGTITAPPGCRWQIIGTARPSSIETSPIRLAKQVPPRNRAAGLRDSPRDAVTRADELLAGTIERLTNAYAERKQMLEEQWSPDESTEGLRQALRGYRAFFNQLLTTGPPAR